MTGGIWKQAVVAPVAFVGAAGALAQAEEPINADRPGIAEGSKVVGHGRLQIEAGVQKESRRAARISDHRVMAPLLLRAGIGQNWEFRLETNSYVFQSSRDAFSEVRQEGSPPFALGPRFRSRTRRTGRRPP